MKHDKEVEILNLRIKELELQLAIAQEVTKQQHPIYISQPYPVYIDRYPQPTYPQYPIWYGQGGTNNNGIFLC